MVLNSGSPSSFALRTRQALVQFTLFFPTATLGYLFNSGNHRVVYVLISFYVGRRFPFSSWKYSGLSISSSAFGDDSKKRHAFLHFPPHVRAHNFLIEALSEVFESKIQSRMSYEPNAIVLRAPCSLVLLPSSPRRLRSCPSRIVRAALFSRPKCRYRRRFSFNFSSSGFDRVPYKRGSGRHEFGKFAANSSYPLLALPSS